MSTRSVRPGARLRAGCLALPQPLVELFDWVFAEQTPYLAEQQAEYADYLALSTTRSRAVERLELVEGRPDMTS